MNKYEQIEKDIQERIKKTISDKAIWKQILGNDVNNENGHIVNPDMDYYAWPGGYPLFYITKDAGALCPKCVNENLELLSDIDDPQWYIVGCEINYEDDNMYCDHCGEQIESAYGSDSDE